MSRSKLRNVNIILLGAFLDAIDALSDASIAVKIYVSSTLLKNCLTFYLAKYTVNISALQHMSLYEVLNLFRRSPHVFRSFLLSPLVARDVVTPKNFCWPPCHTM